jgi:hypothetical protein
MKIELSAAELWTVDLALEAREIFFLAELERVPDAPKYAHYRLECLAEVADLDILRERLARRQFGLDPHCWNCSADPCWCGAAAEAEQDLFDKLG